MDVELAGSPDGVETERQVKQRFSVPVIFATAYASEKLLERMREVAPDGYIGKPFLDNDILALIRKVMDQRATRYHLLLHQSAIIPHARN